MNSFCIKVSVLLLTTQKMSSFLAIFQGFYIHFKQFSKFQLLVKFHEQLFSRTHIISLTSSVTVSSIQIFVACIDPVWYAIIPHIYHE